VVAFNNNKYVAACRGAESEAPQTLRIGVGNKRNGSDVCLPRRLGVCEAVGSGAPQTHFDESSVAKSF